MRDALEDLYVEKVVNEDGVLPSNKVVDAEKLKIDPKGKAHPVKGTGPDATKKDTDEPVEGPKSVSPAAKSTEAPVKEEGQKMTTSRFESLFQRTISEDDMNPVEGEEGDALESQADFPSPGDEADMDETDEEVDLVTRLEMFVDELKDIIDQVKGVDGEEEGEGDGLGDDLGGDLGAPDGQPDFGEATEADLNKKPVDMTGDEDMTSKGKMNARGVKVKVTRAKVPNCGEARTGAVKDAKKTTLGPKMSNTLSNIKKGESALEQP